MRKSGIYIQIVIFALALAVLASCKKDNDADPENELILTTVRSDINQELILDIGYIGNKIAILKEFSRNGVPTTYEDFAFDSRDQIVSMSASRSSTPNEFEISNFTYSADRLQVVEIRARKNAVEQVLKTTFLDYDANNVGIVAQDKDGNRLFSKIATYNDSGNIIQIITSQGNTSKTDTVTFSNYDDHPNALASVDMITGGNDFLPSSRNNRGIVTTLRGSGAPRFDTLTYEYNQQGLVTKIISGRDPVKFEYQVK
ncbi:MAG: hypothetical protein H7Y03_00455 [Chitinophagaceae bacterium]|nr:hypothetical protein [Chitinophagaceae bacterium]